MSKIKDLSGQTFGRLFILEQAGIRRLASGKTVASWLCRCECGAELVRSRASLQACARQGIVSSCGCASAAVTHGMSKTPEYNCWKAIQSRCTNPNSLIWHRYGGRGIECRFNSIHDLIAEIGPRPSIDYSVGRIDNDGHYEPGNVRWETDEQQGGNQSTNIRLTYEGETMTLLAWSKRRGIPAPTVYWRYHRGWTPAKILGF